MANAEFPIKATLVGAGTGSAFGLLAFLALTKWHVGMGGSLFLITPIAAGFSIALVSRGRNSAEPAGILAVAGTLATLIATGKEGALCAALAFPIIAAGLFIGVGIGVLVRRFLLDRTRHQSTTMGVLLLLGPMLIFAGDRIESPFLEHPRTEVIQTSVTVNAPPEEVWNKILSIDNVQASKPFLMYIGLPIPLRCTLRGQGVGARRTCYFNSGYIEETVSGWDPPYYMGLNIDRTHMPGRHWLGFENAEYRLQANGNGTVLTRTTTITSHLRPTWYWRPFERFGVESEHRYILQDVILKVQ